MGDLGERLAQRFLVDRGLRIVATNLRVGHDEIDLVASDGGRPVAVEVKTRVGVDPAPSFTPLQADRLGRAVRAALGIGARCDLVTVRLESDGAIVRWMRGVDVGGALTRSLDHAAGEGLSAPC